MASDNALSYDALMAIQAGTMRWHYRGIETFKNPFDLAIYPLLIAQLRPRTIIEIGSHRGGSALWFADQASLLGLDCHVHSIDVVPVEGVADPRISFHRCAAGTLDTLFSDAFVEALPSPWLVIEDADHRRDTVLDHLRFFARHVRRGDYIVVEDGILTQMGVAADYGGGPLAAIHDFLAEESGRRFAIDRDYCDMFGFNMTWNTDGYLRCT